MYLGTWFATMFLMIAVHCLTTACWTNEDLLCAHANRLLEQCILGGVSLNVFSMRLNPSDG